MSSSLIATASRSSAWAIERNGSCLCASKQRRILSMAQNRLTAVGRVALNRRAKSSMRAAPSAGGRSPAPPKPRAIPIAAATPIAGAPRIAMSRIAAATSSGLRRVR